ncbi:MAG: heme ABC exporter ATP-binding protein CcmA [Chloroflexota bacterium]
MVAAMRAQNEQKTEPVVWARGVTKAFGHLRALRGVDLTVPRGDFLVLFGPNGAGKTTLLRILAGLSRPTAGKIILDGFDLHDDPNEVRRRIGVISHQTFLYEDLTATENLRFYGRMFGVADLTRRIEYLLAQVGLAERADDRVRTFSRGMQQRLSIARAVLHDPSILLLDEPDTGLDERAAGMLHDLIEGLEGGSRTVIMTTHHFERGLALATRVAILNEGKLVRDGPKGNLTGADLRAEFSRLAGGREWAQRGA